MHAAWEDHSGDLKMVGAKSGRTLFAQARTQVRRILAPEQG
jgi:hypothetical protein